MIDVLPFSIMHGDVPEYTIDIQRSLHALDAYIREHIPASPEKAIMLQKVQEASFWLVACVSDGGHADTET